MRSTIVEMATKALLVLLLVRVGIASSELPSFMRPSQRAALREGVRQMFYHAYDNYMTYAFPHDELKPLTFTYTDSLGEFGNLKLEHLSKSYNGSALTLVESLSSLAILGNATEFEKGVLWLGDNLSLDVDVRVNVFECNIRLLGGLIAAHLLAKDKRRNLMPNGYHDQLLVLAEDLGKRLLPAFDTATGIPYAWVNLKHGVLPGETRETSTSGCGSLIIEMGALSRLTGNKDYEAAALRALRKLWSMRSHLNLLGTNLDVTTGTWIVHSTGIGAGVDSFYEYLVKAYILFGNEEYWDIFQQAYVAVQRYLRFGPWYGPVLLFYFSFLRDYYRYHDADMRTGKATYWQFTSLQAFWPGLQVLIGDIAAANATHRAFFRLWEKHGVFPERFLLDSGMPHPTERYYPLRPELAESTFFLYQATRDPWYLEVGKRIMDSINVFSRVPGGFASVRDVLTMELEDHQHSFFLSETCKYLYLLFDDNFVTSENHVFSTEGHPFPVSKSWHEPFLASPFSGETQSKASNASALSSKTCPGRLESACHVQDVQPDHRCRRHVECGVDAVTCQPRKCSFAGFCTSL